MHEKWGGRVENPTPVPLKKFAWCTWAFKETQKTHVKMDLVKGFVEFFGSRYAYCGFCTASTIIDTSLRL